MFLLVFGLSLRALLANALLTMGPLLAEFDLGPFEIGFPVPALFPLIPLELYPEFPLLYAFVPILYLDLP